MRPNRKAEAVICLICAAAVTAAGALFGSETHMVKLPLYETYRCAICHSSSQPTSGQDLNAFGVDFKNNGFKWNAALAVKDSDGDGITNGYEIGDNNGDGVPEESSERSNPGDPLSTPSASMNETTWGVLKSLFD